MAHKKLICQPLEKKVKGHGLNWSWVQFGHRCDPYASVKSDKVDICLSEIAVIVQLFVDTVNCPGNHQ